MSIYIEGMEMPKSCLSCPMLEGDRMDGLCHAASKWLDDDEHWTWYVYPEGDMDDSKPCNCPLVPVPPHGRLGDLDTLYEKFVRLESEAMNALKTTNTGSVNWIKWSAILTERTGYKYDIADAPTIIPAEEGET